jgi:hypothetical protein
VPGYELAALPLRPPALHHIKLIGASTTYVPGYELAVLPLRPPAIHHIKPLRANTTYVPGYESDAGLPSRIT